MFRSFFGAKELDWLRNELHQPIPVDRLLVPEWWKAKFKLWQRGMLHVNASRFAAAVPDVAEEDRIFSPNYVDAVLDEIGRVQPSDVCADTQEPFYEDSRWRFLLGDFLLAPDSCRVMLGANLDMASVAINE